MRAEAREPASSASFGAATDPPASVTFRDSNGATRVVLHAAGALVPAAPASLWSWARPLRLSFSVELRPPDNAPWHSDTWSCERWRLQSLAAQLGRTNARAREPMRWWARHRNNDGPLFVEALPAAGALAVTVRSRQYDGSLGAVAFHTDALPARGAFEAFLRAPAHPCVGCGLLLAVPRPRFGAVWVLRQPQATTFWCESCGTCWQRAAGGGGGFPVARRWEPGRGGPSTLQLSTATPWTMAGVVRLDVSAAM